MAQAERFVDEPDGSCLDARQVGIVVAHPDDEVLWAGGTILIHPRATWRVFTLCRASDPDRAPKFQRVLESLGASGAMADLDDGPEQVPLSEVDLRGAVVALIGDTKYDVIITHGPSGEYARHRRHEEVSEAVGALWAEGTIRSRELWMFAYDDAGGSRLPEAIRAAHVKYALRAAVFREKRRLITDTYGFAPESWEARTTPCWEAFWCFKKPTEYVRWLKRQKERQ